MVCQTCGAELLPEHKFCFECGAPRLQPDEMDAGTRGRALEQPSQKTDGEPVGESEPARELCEWCDYSLEPDARFCIECGRRVMSVEDVRAAAPAPVINAPASANPTQPDQEKPMSDEDVGFLAGLFGASTGCGCGCLPIAGIIGFLILLAALLAV
jgi:uncharacterized OB-fold protein